MNQNQILEYLPEQYQDADVSIHRMVKKNNNIELMALLICRERESVSPQIYLEPFLNSISRGKN